MKVYLIIILSLFIPSQLISQTELSPEEIYQKVNDAVVIVLSYDSNGELRNQGSGVVVSEDSYVLTNYHLMENSIRVKIMHGNLLIEEVEIIGELTSTAVYGSISISIISLIGIAKFRFCPSAFVYVLIPINSPLELTTAPPLLPEDILAVI